MNKGIVSIIVAVILLITSIISGALFFGCAKAPDGTAALENLIDGCNKKSEKQIMKNLDDLYKEAYLTSAFDFSKCVTPDDYIKVFGCSFDYMYDDGCETEKFYIIGTKEEDFTDEMSSYFNSYFSAYTGDKEPSVFYAYLAADYKDADGVSQTAMTTLGVVAIDGKILGFANLG